MASYLSDTQLEMHGQDSSNEPQFFTYGNSRNRDKLFLIILLRSPEGCLIKQVFVLDLFEVFILNLNFLVNFNEDFIKVFVLDLN